MLIVVELSKKLFTLCGNKVFITVLIKGANGAGFESV
jgi:hypothetical protein